MNTNQFLRPWLGKFFILLQTCEFIYLLFCVPKCTLSFITLGMCLDRHKEWFNFWSSHCCQSIEHAFGILMQHWGILWYSFTFSFSCWTSVTMVCIKLHNLCINRNVAATSPRFSKDVRERSEWAVYNNVCEDDCFSLSESASTLQVWYYSKLDSLGIVRPHNATAMQFYICI